MKLEALRGLLAHAGVDGFILPVTDEFLGEYVPPHAARLSWLTGFTGSAGTVVVLPGKAAFFTDGRYMLQAAKELDPRLYAVHNSAGLTPEKYMAQEVPEGARVGFDPRLHSAQQVKKLREALAPAHITLTPLTPNPIDALWTEKTPSELKPAFAHALEFAGESAASKRRKVAAEVQAKGADAAFLSAAESIGWLLNLRGSDLEFTPVVQAYALLGADSRVRLFTDPAKIPADVRGEWGDEVDVQPPSQLENALKALGKAGRRLLIDPAEAPFYFGEVAEAAGAKLVAAPDPCLALKARKSAHELQGIRRAHLIDGAALTRFLHWLETALVAGEQVTEISAADKLLEFRKQGEGFICPSFATIAGSGANGAIVHYRATEASNRALQLGELFLLDSGGQYHFGTTDVTRTVAVGEPSAAMCQHFTLVLKGHIALAMAQFPAGTAGGQLDVLARQFLWAEKLDYDHGTGHGVGYALSVHEGPQRIAKRGGDVALEPGMILSNEPGYYRTGEYGIRIENLVAAQKRETYDGREFLGFDTLTCAPMDRRLIDKERLTQREKQWLDSYHAWVEEMLTPYWSDSGKAWLRHACAPL